MHFTVFSILGLKQNKPKQKEWKQKVWPISYVWLSSRAAESRVATLFRGHGGASCKPTARRSNYQPFQLNLHTYSNIIHSKELT